MPLVQTPALSFFYGSSEHKLNAKGQVAVPARFRSVLPAETLAQGFVLLLGEEACLYCYTHIQFREIVERVRTDPETGGDAEFLRAFFEQVHAVDIDSQGRIVIPGDLREAAGFSSGRLVFLGHNDRIELWDAEARAERRRETAEEFGQKRQRVARRLFGP
jgi:MraZ protein